MKNKIENICEEIIDIRECIKKPILNTVEVGKYATVTLARASKIVQSIRKKHKEFYVENKDVIGNTEVLSTHLLNYFGYGDIK